MEVETHIEPLQPVDEFGRDAPPERVAAVYERLTEIAAAVEVSVPTVERVRRRVVEEGLEAALDPRPATARVHKFDGRQEAHLVALVCGPPPEGEARWTLHLLADKMVELAYVDTVSYETVRRTLKKTNSSRG